MKHQLSLDIPNTGNENIFRLIDTSVYADELPVTCPLIQVWSPGFTLPVQIDVSKAFSLVLNACSLAIQLEDCLSESNPLPDGLYRIKYTVAPADKVYVEYYHLRVTRTLNKYYKALALVELQGCEPPECVLESLKELRLIKSFIDAAKAKVEYLHHTQEGMELLAYADKKLKAYGTGCCK